MDQGNQKFMIGNVAIPNRVLLAPMAGVTDLPFRLLCKEQGAGLVCMEMVSAKAIFFGSKNTESLLVTHPSERPVSLQLFGSDPDIVSEMAKRLEERPFDILDLNMGCPMPKIVNNGEGSALMRDPKLAGRIIEQTARAIRKPVTVKIRKGFDDEHVNAVQIARIAEESGAAAVIVHGRTRQQLYSGKADWEIIARVKDAVHIPVIGNGDVTDGPSALAMMERTGCDAVMIGRACRGNPWLFGDAVSYLETGKIRPRPTAAAVRELASRHCRMQAQYKGEYTAVREMRKHLSWYVAGFPRAAQIRRKINDSQTLSALLEALGELS